MAAVAPSITDLSINGDRSVLKIVWNGLNNANALGAAVSFSEYADRSFHWNGTFNNANIAIEGSNDGGGNYQTLTDPQGNPLAKAAAAIEQLEEITQFVRPNATTPGGAAMDVTVSAVFRRINTMRT